MMAFCCNETIIMSSSCKLQFLAALCALFPSNTITYILLTKLYFINYIRKLWYDFPLFVKKFPFFKPSMATRPHFSPLYATHLTKTQGGFFHGKAKSCFWQEAASSVLLFTPSKPITVGRGPINELNGTSNFKWATFWLITLLTENFYKVCQEELQKNVQALIFLFPQFSHSLLNSITSAISLLLLLQKYLAFQLSRYPLFWGAFSRLGFLPLKTKNARSSRFSLQIVKYYWSLEDEETSSRK